MGDDTDNTGLFNASFKQRMSEFLAFIPHLNDESNRCVVLITCGFLEQILKDILLSAMRPDVKADRVFEGPNAPLGTLSSRILACHALQLISDNEFKDLEIMRYIRNKFAHQVYVSSIRTLQINAITSSMEKQ